MWRSRARTLLRTPSPAGPTTTLQLPPDCELCAEMLLDLARKEEMIQNDGDIKIKKEEVLKLIQMNSNDGFEEGFDWLAGELYHNELGLTV